jgi:hypothetical protein
MMEVDVNDLWLTCQRTSGSIKGSIYEIWAHRILSSPGETPLFMRSLTDGRKTEAPIGERTLLLQQTYEQMTQMKTTMYGVPASKTFPTIDAVCLPYFFQMTIQSSHPIKLKPFAKFVCSMVKARSMRREEKIKLVFVVPQGVIDFYVKCVPYSDD